MHDRFLLNRYVTLYITVWLPVTLRQTHHSRSRGGFTLLEVLVVIGVVALLMSILMPVASSVRHSSRMTSCAANLRQWAMSMRIYAQDNDDNFLPRRGQAVNPTSQVNKPADWFNALPPLIGSQRYMDLAAMNQVVHPGTDSIWICPEAIESYASNYWSYGMNMGLSVWEANQNNGNPDRITRVGDASSMVCFADGPGNYCSVFPSAIAGGYNPVTRHLGRVNLAFLDGHVSAYSGDYIGCGVGLIEHSDVRWHPPGNTWSAR